jgi:putative transposase
MQEAIPLRPGHIYHIYMRGNNRGNLFFEERNYSYFLQLYARHIIPIADTLGYCLMKNHGHVTARIKTSRVSETREVSALTPRQVSQAFSNLFNAYAKGINKTYGRSGSLFEERFERKEVTSVAYLTNLIFYIHFNPQKHGFVTNFREWQWSSYSALVGQADTNLPRSKVLAWFGGAAEFAHFHDGSVDEALIQALIADDFE